MAKLHKIEIYLIDHNDKYSSLDNIVVDIENATDLGVNCFNAKEVEIEWDDELDINFSSKCTVENFRKYFK